MHVLTKIFIVLVSLLAVFLVPLVVVYSHNEDSFKAKYMRTEAQAAVARNELQSVEARLGAETTRLNTTIEEISRENRDLRASADRMQAEVRQLESRLAAADSIKTEINSRLTTLDNALLASQQLNTSLVDEVRTLRDDTLVAERQKVELDEALRDVSSQLEVAVAARRALQEELQRLSDSQAQAMDKLAVYVAQFGALSDGSMRNDVMITPDRNLTATVLEVRRNNDQTLVEIDAGSRDGIQENWGMTVYNGGQFLGKLRIIEVDLNRALGVLTLEDQAAGSVKIGDRASAYAGR